MADLTEPRPRIDMIVSAGDYEWPIVGVWNSPVEDPKNVMKSSFDNVASTRKCCRAMEPMPLTDLMSLVRYIFAFRSTEDKRHHKRIMSAGAIHPVYPIILPKSGINEQPILYQANHDTFVELAISNASKLWDTDNDVQTILPDADGHVVLLAGDKGRVEARYVNPESLLWRDAGVALQMLALTSTACGLGFCPLGILGVDALKGLLGNQERIAPVGMFVIGIPRPS